LPLASHLDSCTLNQLVERAVDLCYRTQSLRIRATLIRLLGDFDLAEDAMQEAFSIALDRWSREGVPANPVAWLISTGRFRAIDGIRKRARLERALEEAEAPSEPEADEEAPAVEDDRLRLIFICCHPLLPSEAQVALTLREVCGLTTEDIARAFLVTPVTLAQRIVRAKTKIREAGIPYEVPGPAELPARLQNVLRVVYLVFNEGYYASSGYSLTRAPLSFEAIRLGRLLLELLPDAEVKGLVALMLLQESRRAARSTTDGDIILLEDQDRSIWNRDQIEEAISLLAQVGESGGAYTLQARIAAVHAVADNVGQTDWGQVVRLYDELLQTHASPVVELNRAVAVAMQDGPGVGLGLIEALLEDGRLGEYGMAFAAHADLCRRLGLWPKAAASYRRALELATQEPERRFLTKRLSEAERNVD